MRELLANDPVSYAAAYTVFATSDLGDRVGEICLPTLIATGEHDLGSNVRMARMMHDAITGSELHTYQVCAIPCWWRPRSRWPTC